MNFKRIEADYFNWIDDFLNPFREHFNFTPCVAIFTNDNDLKCHQELYLKNQDNKKRYFISMFLNLASYMGIGYETKGLKSCCDFEFSNYYVKKQEKDYVFGENNELFEFIYKIRCLYLKYKEKIEKTSLKLQKNDDDWFIFSYDKLFFAIKKREEAVHNFKNFKIEFEDEGCFVLLKM